MSEFESVQPEFEDTKPTSMGNLCHAVLETQEADPKLAVADVRTLGELLEDVSLAEALAASGATTVAELRGLRQLVEQSVKRGIDYATLGLGWDHPESRVEYREARHNSITCAASRIRAECSRRQLVELVRSLVATGPGVNASAAIAAAFAKEISAAPGALTGAKGDAVLVALEAELLLPLRALNEDRLAGNSIARTFGGAALPVDKIQACIDQITAHVLDGTFSNWRYENPVGTRQLEGLTNQQINIWKEPGKSESKGGIIVHEDAPGELGFFWATKIGGPSHGFDFEGQCLLPLLANARHKVILVTDPQWPHNPAGRAHFRLLWTADEQPPRPTLWLETINADFAAGVNPRLWLRPVLAHAVSKADSMGALLSLETYLAQELVALGIAPDRIREVRDRLTLRPSNGVVEASDYLGGAHDWLPPITSLSSEWSTPVTRTNIQASQRPPNHLAILLVPSVIDKGMLGWIVGSPYIFLNLAICAFNVV